jgi:hypothetical protein
LTQLGTLLKRLQSGRAHTLADCGVATPCCSRWIPIPGFRLDAQPNTRRHTHLGVACAAVEPAAGVLDAQRFDISPIRVSLQLEQRHLSLQRLYRASLRGFIVHGCHAGTARGGAHRRALTSGRVHASTPLCSTPNPGHASISTTQGCCSEGRCHAGPTVRAEDRPPTLTHAHLTTRQQSQWGWGFSPLHPREHRTPQPTCDDPLRPTARRAVAESTHRHETYNRWALPPHCSPHKTTTYTRTIVRRGLTLQQLTGGVQLGRRCVRARVSRVVGVRHN